MSLQCFLFGHCWQPNKHFDGATFTGVLFRCERCFGLASKVKPRGAVTDADLERASPATVSLPPADAFRVRPLVS